ncbi:FMN-binding split barrel [Corchorus olitorius]|uniref:FMN-binding split barrel n=1 Tax=Corchorus olitorius TaxID=93759 RepID=A0A1R3JQ19_9ROSI|nr:FMN-binding split barrel [Corchorus olitorius]
MKGSNRASALTLAQKCKVASLKLSTIVFWLKNILASNWQGYLNTIKSDATGSKEDVYTSKVKYILKRGRPYIWVPESDLHNVNTIIDERGSFSVASPFPGPLAKLLKSMNKVGVYLNLHHLSFAFPARVALTGDVETLNDKKAQAVTDILKDVMLSEEKAIRELSYTVSGVLSSSNHLSTSRSENLKELLDGGEKYCHHSKPSINDAWFHVSAESGMGDIISCMFVDCNGGTHEVNFEDIERCKADLLTSYSAKLIDGINQSEARRRALIIFCFIYLNVHARDAFMLSIDRKGFDVLGKVRGNATIDEVGEYQWKQFRFTFKEEARDVESFCRQLVQMEEEAVKRVSSYSGLG